MKIVVTGSLDHISKPLTEELVEKGHSVTVISHNPKRQKDIPQQANVGKRKNDRFCRGFCG